ncbi:lytic polysaccharide monooxygenase [Actinophytocola sp. S1-96]|uniref:Lytic polysaccharide monooxygenase n=2 Tax=Actinophytocola gossypii TaxID=2812003 RepID=A0ABT2JHL5_9PSEU|nr:lytic polysaccharide monooxygenase [Actinophytocola gossypii]
MSGKRITRMLTIAALAVIPMTLVTTGSASAHGYTNSPASRAYHCNQGSAQDCGAIQWEPHSVEGPKGFPEAGPADGSICAGGNTRFAELDDPRGGAWPATDVSGGQDFTFRWHLTARHVTTSFRYFVTRDGWDPGQPLTRAALEPEPFLYVDGQNQQPPADVSHSGTLPNKSGRHLILSVWDIADTGNAFYQCADVEF